MSAQNNALKMFLPITKVDAAQRLVYAIATAEQPDKSNEICDYETTRPLYEKWSKSFHDATGGKSLGNVRAMHGQVAVGKVQSLNFNDNDKQVEVCLKVVDDNEWNKVVEGVYTGVSQGGRYLKRWKDKDDDKLTRYTAEPSEISLVDNPCLPTATFQLIKADGSEELRKFTSVLPEEKKPEAGTTDPEPVAKAAEPAASTEIAPPATNDEGDHSQVWVTKKLPGQTFKTKDAMRKAEQEHEVAERVKELTAPMAKSIEDIKKALDEKEGKKKKPGEKAEDKEEDDEDKTEKVLTVGDQITAFRKSLRTDKELKKGASLYGVSSLLSLLSALACAEDELEYPSMYGVNVDKALTERFGKVVVEVGDIAQSILTAVLDSMKADELSEIMEMATKIGGLTKIGARNSKSDASMIQSIHDYSGKLGASCPHDDAGKGVGADDLQKFAKVAAENEALIKALNDVPKTLGEIMERVKKIEAQPMVIPPHSGTPVFKGRAPTNDGGDDLLKKDPKDYTDDDRAKLARVAIAMSHQNGVQRS